MKLQNSHAMPPFLDPHAISRQHAGIVRDIVKRSWSIDLALIERQGTWQFRLAELPPDWSQRKLERLNYYVEGMVRGLEASARMVET